MRKMCHCHRSVESLLDRCELERDKLATRFDTKLTQKRQSRLKGGSAIQWWRWWESNPRPQALRYEIYMLIPSLISLWATRRAGKTHSQFRKDLTDLALNMPSPRSYVDDSWDPDA